MFRRRLPSSLCIHCEEVPLIVRRSRQAKSLRLSYDPQRQRVCLSLPQRTSNGTAWDFLTRHQDWLTQQVSQYQSRHHGTAFVAGNTIKFKGESALLQYHPTAPIRAKWEANSIICGGTADKFKLRITTFLKAEARRMFTDYANFYTAAIGAGYSRIRISDAVSRWGSCSSTGTLSFNWRLVMADPALSRYVAVHEVCHLRYMNHSKNFWSLVESLLPDYRHLQKRLKQEGQVLRLMGRD